MRLLIHASPALLLLGLCASGCKKETTTTNVTPEKSPVITSAAALPVDNSVTGIAASVDGVTLSRAELMQQVQSFLEARQVPEEQRARAAQYFASSMVNAFVGKTLLLNEARLLKIAVTDAERKKLLQPFEEMAAEKGTTLEDWIKKMPGGETKARQELDDQLLIEKLINTQVREKLPQDVATTQRKEKRAQIETIRTQLLAGTNFADLARAQSDCPSGKQAGGDLGTFERKRMVKAFDEAAFSQKVGEIGPVVETEFGFHVIKVTAHNEAKAGSDGAPATPESVQASHILIKAPSQDDMVKEAVQTYMEGLRAKAKISTMFDRPAGAPNGMPPGMDMPE